MLPDCEKPFPESISLDDTERGQLVSAVMNKGQTGIDEFIKDHQTKGLLGEKIKKLRRELETQLNIVREKKESEYAEVEMNVQRKYTGKIEKIQEREGKIKDLIDDKNIIFSNDILNLINESSELVKKEKKPRLWKRFVAAVKRFFKRIGNAIIRFWDWIRGKKSKKQEKEIVVPSIALPGGKFVNMELAVDRVMANNDFRAKLVDSRLQAMKRSDRLRVYMDEANYREAARKIIQEEIERAIKRQENENKRHKRDLNRQLQELKEEKELIRKHIEEEKIELEKKKAEEIKNIDRQLDVKTMESVHNELTDQFETAGYITRDDKRIYVTSRLVDRFAEIIYAAEIEGLGSTKRKLISGIGGFGEYQRDNIRTAYEIGKLDIFESILNARLNHPAYHSIEEEDIIVNREVKGDQFHVVIMFDKSGSMDENSRLIAAKKAALALFKAVKQHNPKNIVDLVTFDSKVKVMDLVEVWNCVPEGFTNISEAINVSYGLLERSRADKKLIYLITDGLPEAYTSPENNVYIGDSRTSMQYAVTSAMRLKRIKNLKFIMIMLEPKQKMYVDAAEEIAAAANGSVISTDPQDLAKEMLVDYATTVIA